MRGQKLLTNASYFAFTATPKNKTLETFGTAYEDAGVIKHRPFHVYTMKQAIQEGLHSGRAEILHAHRQLLPAEKNGGG